MRTQRVTVDELAQLLFEKQLISADQAKEVVVRAESQRARLSLSRSKSDTLSKRELKSITAAEIIASFKFSSRKDGAGDSLDEDLIMKTLAADKNIPYVNIDPLKLDANLITSTVSLPFARRTSVLPLSKNDNALTVAVCDPYDKELFEELRILTRMEIRPVLAMRSDIQRFITEVYGFKKSVTNAAKEMGDSIDIGNLEQLFQLSKVDDIESNDQHVVNAVDYLLHYAFDQRASDIHIEPKRDHSQVRMRIDGVLHDIYKIPKAVHPAVISRIKTMSRLDLAEKRRPQDGRFKSQKENAEVEMRVSTLPVAFGEKMVIRIFDPTVLIQSTADLGFENDHHGKFMNFVERPNGLILVTGPTGSGKTTTLYSTLRHLSTPEVNVVSIEDPIEMVIEQFNQIAIQPKIGLTFATALRHVLRQDPDIVMVGEIRDKETAEQAIQAALTGHLVISTLHTNDSATSITRMVELGANPFLLASVLVGVVAQRLVRCVCSKCKMETTLTPDQLDLLGIDLESSDQKSLTIFEGAGCVHCRNTGLYGRTGVFELLTVNDTIRELILENADAPAILRAARADGTTTLRESAIRKLAGGITSFDEVIRTTIDADV
ncbi:MAG: Flp pilus assembly complex ATPase component TadA [Deltaproteobacteria bacterium]|nr:Flp pilus assembly complex ATPase component TadA [Deltaproteobacteria bacterium]MBN2672907.1 Flp pilus assembly complex ATPase component TadA [Deltaproteobacteria bacterium]